MRSVDAINGEIGQLRGQVLKHEARIRELEIECAEAKLTGKGFRVGQIIEFPYGKGTRMGRVVGFSFKWGREELKYKTIKKDGLEGTEQKLSPYDIRKAKILEDAPCAS